MDDPRARHPSAGAFPWGTPEANPGPLVVRPPHLQADALRKNPPGTAHDFARLLLSGAYSED